MFGRRLGAVAVGVGALLAGCGGSDDNGGATTPAGGGGGGATKLTLQADPGSKLAFDKKRLTASAGRVTITMTNPSALSHDVSIEGSGVDEHGEVVGKDGSSTVTANLKPGTYTFYCSVPGHRKGGMDGKVTVK